MISDSKLDSILDQVESGIKSMIGHELKADGKTYDDSLRYFFTNQYDVKLTNLLEAAGSDIHHLESGTKNRIILRKQKFFDEL